MPNVNLETREDRTYAATLRAKAKMTVEDLVILDRLLAKYEENRFRRMRADLAEKVGEIRQLIVDDLETLSRNRVNDTDRKRILQE